MKDLRCCSDFSPGSRAQIGYVSVLSDVMSPICPCGNAVKEDSVMSNYKTVEDFMAPWQDKVNWDAVNKMTEKYGLGAYCIPFGWDINHTVTDAVNTAFATDDVVVQPRWTEIPEKIIVSTTITGAFYNKKSNPNHPVTMEEIYAAARDVCLAGAPVIHVHVRNDEGLNVLDPKRLKYIPTRSRTSSQMCASTAVLCL